MGNNLIIEESYGKSSGGDFMAKGRCKAMFRGPENVDPNEILSIKAKLQKSAIRVFDIKLYDQIEITETELVKDWDQKLNEISNVSHFEVKVENEATIHFAKIEWENVDFIRTGIDKAIFVNARIIYSYHKSGYTFGEIEGDLIFKAPNPKPEVKSFKPEIPEVPRIATVKTIIRNTFEPILTARNLSTETLSHETSFWKNSGCLWPILRFFILLLLAFLLFRGCSHFSSTIWDKDKDNRIKTDSTLQIPDGDEKVYKDGKKKFKIDADTTLVVPPGFYKLFIRDHGTRVDHDKVNLIINGQVYKRNMEIFKNPTEIPLTNLKYGENFVDFAVVSQGDSGNCTAEIIFVNTIDSSFTAKLKINNLLNHISRLKLIQR